MATSSEIEKLERKWKENPKGTVFAPYAEALRKHGQLDLAREVLRQGLQSHPDYVPGNIVLGRCCLDLGEDGAAEAAFTQALKLDPENVIALKALAEITERQGRLVESVGWLNQLIAVDPSNDEARDQLARVEQVRQAASEAALETAVERVETGSQTAALSGTVDEASPVPEVEVPTVPIREVRIPQRPEPEADLAGLDIEATVPLMPAASPPLSGPGSGLEAPAGFAPMEADLARAARGMEAEPPAGMVREEEFVPPAREVEELVPPAGPPSQSPEPPRSAAEAEFAYKVEEAQLIELMPASSSEFHVPDSAQELAQLRGGTGEFQEPDASSELALRASGSTEYQTPSGAEELLSGKAAMAEQPTETFEVAPAEPPPEDAGPERPSALRLIFPDEEPAEPPRGRRISAEVLAEEAERSEPGVGEPEPILTESMAEVLVRQGHHEEALSVYRQLLARNPASDQLRGRIRELELVLSAAPARRPAYLASASGGESVESFFRTLVETGLPGGDGPADPAPLAAASPELGSGAPTRPASDPLSLSAIFGDEPPPAPVAPAGTGATEPPPPAPAAFSFDQFFGAPPASPPASGGGQPSIRSGRPSSEEDLDQFQNWLKSLKK